MISDAHSESEDATERIPGHAAGTAARIAERCHDRLCLVAHDEVGHSLSLPLSLSLSLSLVLSLSLCVLGNFFFQGEAFGARDPAAAPEEQRAARRDQPTGQGNRRLQEGDRRHHGKVGAGQF